MSQFRPASLNSTPGLGRSQTTRQQEFDTPMAYEPSNQGLSSKVGLQLSDIDGSGEDQSFDNFRKNSAALDT
jgi:hypothetical protein